MGCLRKLICPIPDKVADRIGGAIVDLAYTKQENPKVAGEILLGHGKCTITIESSVKFNKKEIKQIVNRIVGKVKLDLLDNKIVEYARNYIKQVGGFEKFAEWGLC